MIQIKDFFRFTECAAVQGQMNLRIVFVFPANRYNHPQDIP